MLRRFVSQRARLPHRVHTLSSIDLTLIRLPKWSRQHIEPNKKSSGSTGQRCQTCSQTRQRACPMPTPTATMTTTLRKQPRSSSTSIECALSIARLSSLNYCGLLQHPRRQQCSRLFRKVSPTFAGQLRNNGGSVALTKTSIYFSVLSGWTC